MTFKNKNTHTYIVSAVSITQTHSENCEFRFFSASNLVDLIGVYVDDISDATN